MNYLRCLLVFLFTIATTTLPVSAPAIDFEFFGGVYRLQTNQPITVAWDAVQGATGYELKIVHFFYTGMETQIVETTDIRYTFTNLPRSSRHFEVQVRSYNEDSEGVRNYSTWSSSTDAACSIVDGDPGGWLIYSYPSAPSF